MRIRPALVAAASAALLAATALAPAHASTSRPGGLRPAILKLSGGRLASQQGAPAMASPNAADGVGPGDYLLITRTDGSQWICTANFVWRNTVTNARYLGAAGHCFLPSPDTVGTETRDPANQTSVNQYVAKVEVCVSGCAFGGQLGDGIAGTFRRLGNVVYARQWEGNPDNQLGNDFGLVEIPANIGAPIRTAVPVWGGPNGRAAASQPGSAVCVYGNGDGVGEVFATKARAGVSDGQSGGAWHADLPSFEGDSGAAVENCVTGSGPTALGILTHLTPFESGSVSGTTVARAIQLATSDGGLPIALA